MDLTPIRIALSEETDGYPISPGRVALSTLRAFVRDVDEFIRGDSGEISTNALQVAIQDGSLAIETQPVFVPTLVQDLLKLASEQVLDGVNQRRRAVVERWQRSAKSKRTIGYKVQIQANFLPFPVTISRESDFRLNDADRWVKVERYVMGEVFELGGSHNVNVHLRLPDGKVVVVDAQREMLRTEAKNRLYKPSLIRLSAEYNVATREYRGAKLIEFAEYGRSPDEAALRQLIARGKEAWQSIPSATQWVDEMRAGGEQ